MPPLRRYGTPAIGLVFGTLSLACEPASGGSDAARCADEVPAPGESFVFEIDNVSLDLTDNPDAPHYGFDIDRLSSSDTDPLGCDHPDYFAIDDVDSNCASVTGETCLSSMDGLVRRVVTCDRFGARCHASVDNQLPTLIDSLRFYANRDVREQFLFDVRNSLGVTLVQILDVENLKDDSSVRVRLFRGHLAPGQGCVVTWDGARYQIDRASIRSGGVGPNDAIAEMNGDIIGGRLRARGTDGQILPLHFVFDTVLATRRVEIGFEMCRDGLTHGNFGAWVPGDDWIDIVAVLAPDYISLLRGVVGGLVDIQIAGICDGSSINPARYGGISLGFGFHARPAVIDPDHPLYDGPQPGGCEPVPADASNVGDAAD